MATVTKIYRVLSKYNKSWFDVKKQLITCRYASTEAVTTAKEDTAVSEELEDSRPKKNIPFAKNLFLGRIDASHFVYPELETTDEVTELNQMIEPIEKWFVNDLDSKSIDVNGKIPDDVLQQLKDFGLFGQQIPEIYGGLGLNATKYARIAEATSHDGAVSVTLAAHQAIGLKGILIAGNEAQKAQYLPRLATGELVAAFALTEPSSGSDAASIQSKAVLSADGRHYLLTGGKIWCTNGGIADVFTVFAKTPITSEDGITKEKVTAFIVERAFGGVTSGKPEDKLGIRGSNTCEVHFDETPVPLENVLGEVGGGFKVAMNILNSGRFSMGSSVAGTLKRLMASAAEHALSRRQFGKPLAEFGLIQEKFAKMSAIVYAMESMAYMTAGVMDNYQEPDCVVEAAMVKIFASEGGWFCINEILQLFGGQGYMKDYPYERYLRDSRILLIFEGTNEILRLFVGLTCVEFAGKELLDTVKKLTDPLNNVGFVLRMVSERTRAVKKGPSINFHHNLHPSLKVCAKELDARITKFRFEVERQLNAHKKDIVNQQLVVKRLTDVAVDAYAGVACLARATRSLAIGLQHAPHEAMLCQYFLRSACARMDVNLEDLYVGTAQNGDEHVRKIASDIFKNGGYVAVHPLTRNW